MADLARNASFPEDEFERERRQRFEELRVERTTPGFLASERLRRVLFGEHPYAIIAPTEEQVADYRREQLEEFYRQHYVPADALLIVVGDFSADAMLEQIEKDFRRLEGAATAAAGVSGAAAPFRPPRASGAFAGHACRRRSCSGTSASRGAIRTGIAWCSRTRFMAARFIRGW